MNCLLTKKAYSCAYRAILSQAPRQESCDVDADADADDVVTVAAGERHALVSFNSKNLSILN